MKKMFLFLLLLSSIAKGLPIDIDDIQLIQSTNGCWITAGTIVINDILKSQNAPAGVEQEEFVKRSFNIIRNGGGRLQDIFMGIKNCFKERVKGKTIKFYTLNQEYAEIETYTEESLESGKTIFNNFNDACEAIAPYYNEHDGIRYQIQIMGLYSRMSMQELFGRICSLYDLKRISEEQSMKFTAAVIDHFNQKINTSKDNANVENFLKQAIKVNKTPIIAYIKFNPKEIYAKSDQVLKMRVKIGKTGKFFPASPSVFKPIYANKNAANTVGHFVIISDLNEGLEEVEIIDCREDRAFIYFMSIKELKTKVLHLAYAEIIKDEQAIYDEVPETQYNEQVKTEVLELVGRPELTSIGNSETVNLFNLLRLFK